MPIIFKETKEFKPKFRPALHYDGTLAPDLITVVLQENPKGNVLYAATMNAEALALTLKTMRVHLYSREAKKVRRKGATSGNELAVMDICINCNEDCLLIKVNQLGGGVCHTKNEQGQNHSTCFYRVVGKIIGKTTEYVLSFLE